MGAVSFEYAAAVLDPIYNDEKRGLFAWCYNNGKVELYVLPEADRAAIEKDVGSIPHLFIDYKPKISTAPAPGA